MSTINRKLLRALAFGLAPTIFPVSAMVSHAIDLKAKEQKYRRERLFSGERYPYVAANGNKPKSMAEILEELRSVPLNSNMLGGISSTLVFSMADVIPMMLECRKSTCGVVYKYPSEFERVVIKSEDGTPLCAMVGIHKDGRKRPALIMVHGLFGSKSVWFSQQVVLSAYYGWGYNVMALDLRFFGESKLYSDAPGTGGWKEGQDIIAAARYMKSLPEVTSVAVMGGSYGGASAMCAAYQSEPRDLIDGGIISWGGYGYMPDQVRFISTLPKPSEPFFTFYFYFMGCFTLTLGGKVLTFRNFEEYLRKHSASYYGVDGDFILEKSSAALHFDEVKTPLFIINSQDDPIIPASQAKFMEERSRSNPNIKVWLMERGGHCAFSVVDRQWMSRVTRGFFNYWAKT